MSVGPRLVMNSQHRKDGKWSTDKGSIDSVTKTEPNGPSRFSGGDSFIKRCNPKLGSNKNGSNLELSMF